MHRKPKVTSARAARVTTIIPMEATKNAKSAASPHCPDDTQASRVSSSIATIPKFVGLKTCFPRTRTANLLTIARVAATAATSGDPVRNSKHSESAEITALL
jgi:hypothetical protein